MSEEEAEHSLAAAHATLDQLEPRLAGGRYLQAGPAPTYIDFHLASMVALLLPVPQYTGIRTTAA